MRWSDIRLAYPEQWLVIEILESHTDSNRIVPDGIAVLETCPDGAAAFERYRALHRDYPQRFVSFIHTHREKLEIEERFWAGIRTTDAA
jgi:hypothetical protein